MDSLNKDFEPWTLLAHATNAFGDIADFGSLVPGNMLFILRKVGTSSILCQLANVTRRWQELSQLGDRSSQEWLRGNEVFQSLPKDKDFLMLFFADYMTKELENDLGTTTNGQLEGSMFLSPGPVPFNGIACVNVFDQKWRSHDDGKSKLLANNDLR